MQDFAERLNANKYVNTQKTTTIPGLKKLQQMDLPIETKGISYAIEILRDIKDYIDIRGWAFINDKNSEGSVILLGLSSDRNNFLINTSLIKRPDVTVYFKTSLNLNDSGFSAIIAKEELEVGTYKIGIYIKKENFVAFQYTDRIINIQK
jgi:hypothetical protein